MKFALSALAALAACPTLTLGAYNLARNYSGQDFFNGWTYYGNFDNLTNGDAIFVNQTNATAMQLTYVNSAGNAILRVDNSSFVPYNQKRDTVRISTSDYFPVGTVWIIDAIHLPFGCSVWPSFWTMGVGWPAGGEIDIIEGVNLMPENQMALHTTTGCTQLTPQNQTGTSGNTNCSQSAADGAGCTVMETQQNSYGQAFASAGGGVWATQFDVSGIYIWFWSRGDIPADISSATDSIDSSTWGVPSASYPASSCNITEFFQPQQLVLDITLCGDWAGEPSVYSSTGCGAGASVQADTCYISNVINNGTAQYADAYFEIAYVKAYTVSGNVETVNGSTETGSNSSTGPSGSGSSSAPAPSGSGSGSANAALPAWASVQVAVAAGAALLAGAIVAL